MWDLARAGLRVHWALALAHAAALVAATAVAVALPLAQTAAADAALRAAVAGLGSRGVVTIEQRGVRTEGVYDGFQSLSDREVARELGQRVRPGARYAATTVFIPQTLNGLRLGDIGTSPPSAGYYDSFQSHAALTAGRWPQNPPRDGVWEATIAESGAQDYGLKPGDVYCLAATGSPTQRWCALIAGVWRPASVADHYWGPGVPVRSLLLDRGPYFQLLASVPGVTASAGQLYTPRPETMRASDAPGLAAGLARLAGLFSVRREGAVSSGLQNALEDFARRQQDAQPVVLMVVVVEEAVVLLFVWTSVGRFLGVQREQLAVWRSRGWSRLREWCLLMLEFGLVALVALPAGVGAGVLGAALGFSSATSSVAAAGGFDPALVLPAGAALAGVAAIGGLRSWLVCGRSAQHLRRPPAAAADAWWRWRNLDLLAGVLALPVLAWLRLGSGTDVWLIGVALVAVAALVVAGLRLMPAMTRLALLLRPGVPARLMSLRLSRQPGTPAALAGMLAAAFGLAVFSTLYAATERQGASDRAGYQAGADVRAHFMESRPPPLSAAAGQLRGVAASAQVYRGQAIPGNSRVEMTVLGVGADLGGVAFDRPDLTGRPLPNLVASLDPGDGLRLPDSGSRLTMWVFGSGLGARLVGELRDARGRNLEAGLGSVQFDGWKQLGADLPGGLPGSRPLRLTGLRLVTVAGGAVAGDMALSDLQAVSAGGEARTLESFAAASGWWLRTMSTTGDVAELGPSQLHPRNGQPTLNVAVRLTADPVILLPRLGQQPLPMLMGTETLRALGVGLHQTFLIHFSNHDLPVSALDRLDWFPSVDPAQERFAVLDRDAMLDRLARDELARSWPNELWLRQGGGAGGMTSDLRFRGDVTQVVDRASLLSVAARDPLKLVLETSLLVGLASALGLAALATASYLGVESRARVFEHAVLAASGLPVRQAQASLAAEGALLLLAGLVLGTGAGLLFGQQAVPVIESYSATAGPPALLRLEWVPVLAALLVVAAGAAGAGAAVARLAGRFQTMDQIRQMA